MGTKGEYVVLEPDGVTLVEFKQGDLLRTEPKEGRLALRDGVVRYVAKDGGWVWAGVRTA